MAHRRGVLGLVACAAAIALCPLLGCGDELAGDVDAATLDEQELSATELLGKRLFEDTNLSEPPGQSCASCHDPKRAFTGNAGSSIDAIAAGSRPGRFGSRNAPTAMYAMFSPPFSLVPETNDKGVVELVPTGGQFWDGRAASLTEQAKGPFVNPDEMNNPDPAAVVAKVRASSYAALFRRVYGADALEGADPTVAYDRIAAAIAAFEQTSRFRPFSSKFDDVLRGNAQLDATERLGLSLFRDPKKGNCIACHVGGGDDGDSKASEDWLFTDFTYDTLGVPRNANLPANADSSRFDLGLCAQPGFASRAPAGFDVASTCGAFKVPTLRNVAVTAPYMHNGYFETLRDVVRFYATRDTSPDRWYPHGPDGDVATLDDLPPEHRRNVNTTEVPYDRKAGEAPRLDDDEIDAIVAFLRTLTDR
jgi:cytochrome c peroxidase